MFVVIIFPWGMEVTESGTVHFVQDFRPDLYKQLVAKQAIHQAAIS